MQKGIEVTFKNGKVDFNPQPKEEM